MNHIAKVSSPSHVLRAGDLIDDRELANADRDRLDHDRIADELVDLVTTVETPTNVALYGPWGSGKSGIANLMRLKLNDAKTYKGVKFVRFDAFKYADIPLRRTFVTAVAGELEITDAKYGRDLYAGKTKTTIDIPNRRKVEIAVYFIGLTAVLILALVGIIALLSLLQPGSWHTNFGKNFSAALPASLISPVLLATVFTLVGKTLTVDRSVDKPESVEQFEELFKELVVESKADRLIIFVDELDRCTAKEVVTTLDAIRTFLGVDKCVFIVAADQHVLEQALSEEARQETPEDSVNPYYSTGSAYLDKVFQYQLSVPPLLPQSVTEFAVNAVKDRDGLWQELPGIDYVVSILIPAHVTSPRRVKHLLNAFALTYRLAQSKHTAGQLNEDPVASAQAIAKLVCLRVEFPNFARDLSLDSNLPSYVLALRDNLKADLGPRVSPHVRERALAYATGEVSPAKLLTDSPAGEDEERVGDAEGGQEATVETEVAAPESVKSSPKAQQGRELINYLTRTRLIEGPSRDVVYLHSVGSVYGLSDDLARDLVSAVENGQLPETRELYQEADESDLPRILQYVASQARLAYGIEHLNAAHILLDLAQTDPVPDLSAVADTAGQAMAAMHRSGEAVLTDESAPGAWRLATSSDGDGARSLQRTVLRQLAAEPSWNASYLFADPLTALAADSASATTVMARELLSERAAEAVSQLKDQDDQAADKTLRAIRVQSGHDLAELFKQREAQVAETPKPEAEQAANEELATTTAPPELPITEVLSALKELAASWAQERPQLAWSVVYILLLGNHSDSRQEVAGLLSQLGKTSDPPVVTEMLKGVRPRPTGDWFDWLATIPAGSITSTHSALLTAAAETLVSKALGTDDEVSLDVVKRAVEQLTRLVEARPAGTIAVTPQALAAINAPVTTEAEASRRIWTLERLRVFVSAGLIDSTSLATKEIANMRQTLATALPLQEESAALTSYVTQQAARAAGDLVGPNEETAEELFALSTEVRQSGWLSERMRLQGAVAILASATSELRAQAQEHAPTIDELLAYMETIGQEAAATAASWVSLMAPDRATAERLLRGALAGGSLNEDIAVASARNAENWTDEDQFGLVTDFLAPADQSVPGAGLLKAVGFEKQDSDKLATMLVDRFEASGSNSAKETVTTLWGVSSIGHANAEQLYKGILMPWLRSNVGDATNADAARRALVAAKDLSIPVPDSVRGEFADIVIAATEGDKDLTRAAIPALEVLGFSADRIGIFRKRLEVSDNHDE